MTPLTIVIFGASGDLTARKLIPALYQLHRKGRLPNEAQIVGVARSPFTDDAFREKLAGALREFEPKSWQPEVWESFARRLYYVACDAVKPKNTSTAMMPPSTRTNPPGKAGMVVSSEATRAMKTIWARLSSI